MSKYSNKRGGKTLAAKRGRNKASKNRFSCSEQTPSNSTVKIHDLTHDGRGVAYLEGRTVFVAGALPGELVEICFTSQRGKFDEANVVAVEHSSPERVEPLCPHFYQCGGCQLQYLQPAQQIIYKQQQLLQALQRLAKVVPRRVQEPLTASAWQYRRRARLGVRFLPREHRVEVGFRQFGRDQITAVNQCLILKPPFSEMMPALSQLILSLNVAGRIPQIELLAGDEGNAINLHILAELSVSDQSRLQQFGEQQKLTIYVQTEGVDTVRPLSETDTALVYHLPDYQLSLEFLPGSFLQINAEVNEKLIASVLELLQLDGSERVLDLFCGLGNFTLPLATKSESVVGVEGNARAVRMAEQNCLRNNITNAEFFVADLADDKRDRRWQNRKYDVVVLDPPRSGAVGVLQAVARTGATKIVYISCHPGSLARDVGILVRDYGYKLDVAGAVDMFPQTTHLESIVLLTR